MNKTRVLVLRATRSNAPLTAKHEAFAEIVRHFQDMAYACAYAVLGDSHLAQDAAQEAFISAWQKLRQLRQPEAFPGWFRRIVLTECHRLKRSKRLRSVSLDDGARVPSAHPDPQTFIERNELAKAIFTAIETLPKEERIVVVLFYVREYSHRDISAFLEVPLTTVAKRLYSARVRLRGLVMAGFKKNLAAHRPSRNGSFAKKVRAGIYDEYVGKYRFERRPELVVTITRQGDRLVGEASGQRNELFSEDGAENELRTSEFDGRGKFLRDKKGRISKVIYFEFGREMGLAKKIC